jgi:outer membrane protein TolC
MNSHKRIITGFLLISLFNLTACSEFQTKIKTDMKKNISDAKSTTNITANRLHKEAQNYQYSSYVQQNLKARKIPNATVTKYSTLSSRHYTTQQIQLKNRKKQANASIRSAIVQNGLYRPQRIFQQQLSALHGRDSHQSWLEGHASLKGVLALALKNNLEIQSQQLSALSRLSQYDQVSYLDDILLQYNAFTNDLTLTGSTQKHKRSASTGFPFPALRALKANILDQNIEVSRLKLKQTTQDIITQTRLAYYELQYSQYNISLTQKMGKLLTSLKEELKNNYEVNTAKLGDILQIDIEIEQNNNDVSIAKDKQQAQQARLNTLLNLPTFFKLSKLDALKPIKLTANSQQLIKTAKRKRIEIAKLEAKVEKMQRIIRLSDRRFYPDFDAGYSRFQNSMSKQVGSNANRATFSNRPKIKNNSFFATNDAYLTETKAKVKALQAKIKALKIKTEDELLQAYTRYQSQQRNHSLYQSKILPKANASLDIAKNNFETGDSSFMDIMQAQESILRYRLLAFKAVKEMNVEVAKIWRVMGSE